jgi:hypothetical protein
VVGFCERGNVLPDSLNVGKFSNGRITGGLFSSVQLRRASYEYLVRYYCISSSDETTRQILREYRPLEECLVSNIQLAQHVAM